MIKATRPNRTPYEADRASIAGILLAFAAVLGGMLLEGGSLTQIVQPAALMIVLGGTTGAVMLQFPLPVLISALQQGMRVFSTQAASDDVIPQIVSFAAKARRRGLLSIDADLQAVDDPFLKQAFIFAIDMTEPAQVRAMMELHMDNTAEREEKIPEVFEAVGGYAPTVGILGAVLGLIQVMQHLEDIAAVGSGIAVAFVATIYGVALANLLALPIAGKLRTHHEIEQRRRRMMLEGVVLILEGISPRMIDARLRTYLDEAATQKLNRTVGPAEQVTA